VPAGHHGRTYTVRRTCIDLQQRTYKVSSDSGFHFERRRLTRKVTIADHNPSDQRLIRLKTRKVKETAWRHHRMEKVKELPHTAMVNFQKAMAKELQCSRTGRVLELPRKVLPKDHRKAKELQCPQTGRGLEQPQKVLPKDHQTVMDWN
jgi:hypothetical protein